MIIVIIYIEYERCILGGRTVIKKMKLFALLTGLVVFSLALAACGNNEEKSSSKSEDSAKERTVTDAMGHEVTIPENPKRVLASYLEDNLVALGVTPVAQWSVKDGKSTQEYLSSSLKDVPTIPSELPLEAVASYKPDLIILDSPDLAEGGKYEQYAKIAPTYVIGTEQNNDWRKELTTVGELLNKSDEAKKALKEYDQKVKEAKSELEEKASDESAAALWLVGGKFFMVSDNLSSGAVIYGDLGIKEPNVVKEVSSKGDANWLPVSLEKLAQLDADHIFLINSDKESGSKALEDPLWKNIPAVKNGNVHEYGQDASWLYTGTIANKQIVDNVVKDMTK